MTTEVLIDLIFYQKQSKLKHMFCWETMIKNKKSIGTNKQKHLPIGYRKTDTKKQNQMFKYNILFHKLILCLSFLIRTIHIVTIVP